MFYEDSKMNLKDSLVKLSAFLEKPLKDEELPRLIDHLQFDNAKKNPSINFTISDAPPTNKDFMRRGKVGGNPEITEEISKKFDEWEKINVDGSELKFPYC